MRRPQRSRQCELREQPSFALVFPEIRVTRAIRAALEQFANNLCVHAGVLAHIERTKVKSEHLGGTTQIAQPPVRDARGAMRFERLGDHIQIANEVCTSGVGRRVAECLARSMVVAERAGGSGEPRVNAGERAAIRLVFTVRRKIR
ncbi:MAG: hypothetical protein A2W18_13555 [Candidatus Muproteobacteria bacterium RBG_16_60_9]|uniref:Uncharacterized protein n=1 Tax=Candidatus Muproteobacteria bacterium RBG_16_60_9 TaxID=1817755 RepID=A0A1F6V523_9PROT|nr:MAG: hypothetical protein A2W18_13555 [Candidatus Muproteobacteria bacterium RBG_16_60_9]